MSKYKNFSEFPVWTEMRQMLLVLYQLFESRATLKHAYWIRDQLLRASLSIMNNIAEGFDCPGKAEKIRFYQYAKRSTSEVESMLFVLLDIKALSEQEFDEYLHKIRSVRKQINGLIKKRLSE